MIQSEFLSSLQNQTVVVTGGAGFIGSHLCDAFLAAGAKVVAIDNLLTGNKQNIQHLLREPIYQSSFTFIQADVSQPAEQYLPTDLQPDLICHFASPASPPRYQAHPVETYLVNSLGTHYLLQYLKTHHPQARFLFAGTSEIYGDPLEHPQKETYWGNVNPNGVRSCYDESKRFGETICGVHSRDFEMDVRIVRIFNTYGPRMDIEDGRVIPDFIQQCLQSQPLKIFGDGKQTRSFCFIDDLVRGILLLATEPRAKGQTVNLGNPEEHTVREAAQVVWRTFHQETSSHEPPVTFLPLPQDDPTRRRPDISRAQQLLRWSPTIPFDEGIRQTVAFYRARSN